MIIRLFKNEKRTFLSVLLLSSALNLFGQSRDTTGQWLLNKFDLYRAAKAQNVIYAHFDKNIYTNDENVWFTAYLLKRADPEYTPHILHVVLLNNVFNQIALRTDFYMDKGISFGNVFIPDTLTAGSYSFVLYTEPIKGSEPNGIFVQPVTIKVTQQSSFRLRLNLDSNITNDENYKVTAFTENRKNNEHVTFSYSLGSAATPPHDVRQEIAKSGSYAIVIPKNQIRAGSNTLYVQMIVNGEKVQKEIVLPIGNVPSVRFFPEGGNLITGLSSKVGFEVKNPQGAPLHISAVVFDNKDILDTVNSNGDGLGYFFLKPQSGHFYTMKLLQVSNADKIYDLPKAIKQGGVITIRHAIVDDTLSVVAATASRGRHFIMIHNYQNVYALLPVQTGPDGRLVNVVLREVPRGLAEITLLDSLYRPYSERLFFSHFHKCPRIQISTVKTSFKKREKVEVTLKLNSPFEKEDEAYFSVACVENARINPANKTDIISSVYLKDELGNDVSGDDLASNSPSSMENLEKIILIHGWRRYTWQGLMETSPKDTGAINQYLYFSGTMSYNGRPLKKPATIVVMRDSSVGMVTTDAAGNFKLAYQEMLTQQDKKLHLLSTGHDRESYNIVVNDPFKRIDQLLKNKFDPQIFVTPLRLSNDQTVISGFEHNIMLNEVIIKGQGERSSLRPVNANPCGDYVCIYNILNCAVHRNDKSNTTPIAGHRYLSLDPVTQKVQSIVYQGCNTVKYNNSIEVNGIYFAKEFYPADYSAFNPPEPDYLSTIYWNHFQALTSGKEVTLSFYTSDVTGPFKIILQGVTSKDVVYAEKDILVH